MKRIEVDTTNHRGTVVVRGSQSSLHYRPVVTPATREHERDAKGHLSGLALRGWRGLVKHRIEFNHRVLYMPKDTPYQLAARWDAIY